MSRSAWTKLLEGVERNEHAVGRVLARSQPKPKRRKNANPAARAGSRIADLLAQIATTEHTDISIPDIQQFPMRVAPKPRMNQSDRWKKRACVLRYRACCDELRMRGVRLPHRYSVVVVVPMPPSWPENKRQALDGQPCLSKPDMSNYLKTVEDALVPCDERLWSIGGAKVWGREAKLVVLRAGQASESMTTLLNRALGENGMQRSSNGYDNKIANHPANR